MRPEYVSKEVYLKSYVNKKYRVYFTLVFVIYLIIVLNFRIDNIRKLNYHSKHKTGAQKWSAKH
jgi:hypothetical protein